MKLIKKQGQAWENNNCGELWEIAIHIYKDIIEEHVPEVDELSVVKTMLRILEKSSGCTGMAWKDE